MQHLEAYLNEFHKGGLPETFLFYTIHGLCKTQMKPGTVDYFLKKYAAFAIKADEAFPKNLHAHTFRHSVAMAMYKKGIPISYIRDFLGHISVETTAIYSYSDDETILNALEAIDHERFDETQAASTKNWKGNEQYLLEYCGLA